MKKIMKTKDSTGNWPGGREKRVLYLDMGCEWGELEGVRKIVVGGFISWTGFIFITLSICFLDMIYSVVWNMLTACQCFFFNRITAGALCACDVLISVFCSKSSVLLGLSLTVPLIVACLSIAFPIWIRNGYRFWVPHLNGAGNAENDRTHSRKEVCCSCFFLPQMNVPTSYV